MTFSFLLFYSKVTFFLFFIAIGKYRVLDLPEHIRAQVSANTLISRECLISRLTHSG